jgi:hypothetical protein
MLRFSCPPLFDRPNKSSRAAPPLPPLLPAVARTSAPSPEVRHTNGEHFMQTAHAPRAPDEVVVGTDDGCARAFAGLNADLGRCCWACSAVTCAASRMEDSNDRRFSGGEAFWPGVRAEGEGVGGVRMGCAGSAESEGRRREGSVMSVLEIGESDDAADAAADTGEGSGSAELFGVGLEQTARGEAAGGDREECRIDRAFGAARSGVKNGGGERGGGGGEGRGRGEPCR